MTWLDAMFGKIYNAGDPVELAGGINFHSGFKATYNSATKRVDVAFDSTFEGELDHGGLAGLDDDDHPQYARADGTRAFSYVAVGANPAASGLGRLANAGGGIRARNATNTGDVSVVYVSITDQVVVGGSGCTGLYFAYTGDVIFADSAAEVLRLTASSLRPSPTNAMYLGDSTHYWSAGYITTLIGSTVTLGATPAMTGMIRLPFGPRIAARDDINANDVTVLSVSGTTGSAFFGSESLDHKVGGTGITALAAPQLIQLRTAGTSRWVVDNTGLYPNTDNAYPFGSASNRPTVIWAVGGTINTSDVREKQDIAPIDDALLDAWADVSLVAYRWITSVDVKGDDARIHTGAIAQQVRDALAAHGIDGRRYGLLCYDEWDDAYEPDLATISPAETAHESAKQRAVLARAAHRALTEAERVEAELPEPGDPEDDSQEDRKAAKASAKARVDELRARASADPLDVAEAAEHEAAAALEAVADAKVLVTPAGNRWGLRYSELLIVEAAYQRRRADRIEARLDALEKKGAK